MEIARELVFESSEDEYIDSEEEISQQSQQQVHSWLESAAKYSQIPHPVSKPPEVTVSETEGESDQEVQPQHSTMLINETIEDSVVTEDDELIETSIHEKQLKNDKIRNTSWKKDEIVAFLDKHNV